MEFGWTTTACMVLNESPQGRTTGGEGGNSTHVKGCLLESWRQSCAKFAVRLGMLDKQESRWERKDELGAGHSSAWIRKTKDKCVIGSQRDLRGPSTRTSPSCFSLLLRTFLRCSQSWLGSLQFHPSTCVLHGVYTRWENAFPQGTSPAHGATLRLYTYYVLVISFVTKQSGASTSHLT